MKHNHREEVWSYKSTYSVSYCFANGLLSSQETRVQTDNQTQQFHKQFIKIVSVTRFINTPSVI